MAAKRSTRQSKKAPKKAAKAPSKKAPTRKAQSNKASTKKASTRKASAKKASAKKAAPKKAASRAKPAAPRGSAAADRVHLVQEIIDVMEARGAVEVEFKDGDFKLRVRRREEHAPQMQQAWTHAPMPMAPAPAPAHAAAPAAAAPVEDPDALPAGTEVFASPMVGTFYRAAQPDAEPFAKEGQQVGPDHVLCIIEAMKVMNEIKAERAFEIVRVLAENGEPVEFGQPLFVVKA